MTISKQQSISITKFMAADRKDGAGSRPTKNGRRRPAAILLFLIYFVILFYFLFFAESMGRTYSERTYHYNLVPFLEIRRFITYYQVLGMKTVLLNILGNILAFLPFGLFLPFFSRRCRRLWYTMFYSFELSLLVELIQLVSKVGTFDVDDLMLNTLGGVLGYFLYKAVAAVVVYREKHHKKSRMDRS